MTTSKNSLDSQNTIDQTLLNKTPVQNLVDAYNKRLSFFSGSFIKKIRDGNRKAIAELAKYDLPPTQMDLRQELSACIKRNVPDDHLFIMDDSKEFSMQELKRLIPEWASIAEQALMKSDPQFADKLMTREQWNARSAFEVTFLSAMNEIREIKETKKASSNIEFYRVWIIKPLKLAMEQIKLLETPNNSLIGQAQKISLKKALEIAEGVEEELEALCAGKKPKRFLNLF